MTLKIAIVAAGLLLKWDVPGPGSYCLISTTDYRDARVEAAGHVWNACHASKTVHNPDPHRIYWVWFQPDPK